MIAHGRDDKNNIPVTVRKFVDTRAPWRDIVLFHQRRLVMYHAEGGVGVHNETTDEPELREQAIKLMRALRWHGPAQVEFKRDARDGRARLMEVNPRFWGTLDLAIQAGMNFPYLTAMIAKQNDVTPESKYTKGSAYAGCSVMAHRKNRLPTCSSWP